MLQSWILGFYPNNPSNVVSPTWVSLSGGFFKSFLSLAVPNNTHSIYLTGTNDLFVHGIEKKYKPWFGIWHIFLPFELFGLNVMTRSLTKRNDMGLRSIISCGKSALYMVKFLRIRLANAFRDALRRKRKSSRTLTQPRGQEVSSTDATDSWFLRIGRL